MKADARETAPSPSANTLQAHLALLAKAESSPELQIEILGIAAGTAALAIQDGILDKVDVVDRLRNAAEAFGLLGQCGEDRIQAAIADGLKSIRGPRRARPSNSGGLTTITAAELQDRNFAPIAFVVPGFIAEGLTVLAGRPKVGKSWLALGLAISVSTGGTALGSINVEQGDVLYLALEDNNRRLKSRLEQTLDQGIHPERLHLATACPRLGAGGVEAIEGWCDSVKLPRLVLVDVFGKIKPPRRGKADLYEEDYRAIEPLKTLADKRELAIVIVHHTNKREEPADPFDSVSGTTGLTGAADTVLVLARSSNGPTLYGRGRDIEETETALKFDRTTGHWTVLGDATEVRRSSERNRIMEVLRNASAPLGPKDIAILSGLKSENVRQLLGKMVESGEIEKGARGAYRFSSR
jgi:hypothetical protein